MAGDGVENNVVDGYLENKNGHLVPRHMVSDLDSARDDLVHDIAKRWIETQAMLRELKQWAMDSLAAFCELSAEQYGIAMEGKKGNFTVLSFNGRYKVQMQIHEFIAFDERAQVAKRGIDVCVKEWMKGSDINIKAIVDAAFDTDARGNMSTARILGLRRLKIDDERWMNAMAALSDCMTVVGSKSYIRVYERVGDDNKMVAISLDIATL